MALREIITYPHPILKATAKPVDRVDDTVRKLIDDMVDTLYAAPGIGLAAPQVSQSVELCIVDIGVQDNKPGSDLVVLVNPKIVSATGKVTWNEGCLSLPEFEEEMDRAANITVEATGRDGKVFRLDAEGLKAVAIQHEMDHLRGVTLADRVSFLKRNLYLQRIKKGKVEKRPYNRSPAL